MLNVLYPALIMIGLTIVGVMAYLWWQARKANHINLELIQLNETLQFDTPRLLQNAWPLLERSGLCGMHWELDWFGVVIKEEHGTNQGRSIEKFIAIGEMKLFICIWQKRFGEHRYFSVALIESFFLLLRTDMWIKAGTIDATLSQMSKLNLFLQHDMKNVAQFIQLMADQLANMQEGKEHQILSYLRAAAPLIRQRADHIVQTLTIGHVQEETPRTLILEEMLHQIANLYQLNYQIDGNAKICFPSTLIEQAFDNILKNYNDLYIREGGEKPTVMMTLIDHTESLTINITTDRQQNKIYLERLFEPFWSSDTTGLGIGLYQAKHLLERCGASLYAMKSSSGILQFQICIAKST